METLSKEDIRNIGLLIAKADIKGGEAVTVALLQQKLQKMFDQLPELKEEEKKK